MSATSYPPEFVVNLEMLWGGGFLSPGGAQEVLEILRDIELDGKTLLDIGCGTGGPDLVIARELKPARIVGIDVEPYLVELGQENITNAGLNHIIDLVLVEGGQLPFPDASFDILFSKDSLIHIEDKSALYKDALRVLKPGGIFAASDWLRSEDADSLAGYNEWRSLTPHGFTMQTDQETKADMRSAGFLDIATRDRNDWYVETAARELQMMKSDAWHEQFVRVFDEERYEKGLALRAANAGAAECGGLRPTHLFGKRPL